MVLRMPLLDLSRDEAIQCYENVSAKRRNWFDAQLKDKDIKKGSLVVRYESYLDTTFQTKFRERWEGPFIVREVFDNGSYQLQDLDDMVHPTRVNGYRLKKYISKVM